MSDDNKLAPNNDGLKSNSVGQVLNDDELVPNYYEQVPNDKNQWVIMMNLCLIMRKQA